MGDAFRILKQENTMSNQVKLKNTIPPNLLFVLGGVGLAMYFLKPIRDFIDPDKRKREEEAKHRENSTSIYKNASGNLDITISQAKSIAEQQFDAMKDFGTEENSLFDSLKNLSGKDLAKIYEAFGKRRYFAGGRAGYLGETLDLFGWYRSELGDADMKKMARIWKKAGVIIDGAVDSFFKFKPNQSLKIPTNTEIRNIDWSKTGKYLKQGSSIKIIRRIRAKVKGKSMPAYEIEWGKNKNRHKAFEHHILT